VTRLCVHALLPALCLALWAVPSAAPAQVLGKLVLDSFERRDLERARRLRPAPGGQRAGTDPSQRIPEPEPTAPAPAPAANAPLTVNGWVLRRDGRSTVWVNNEPYYRFDSDGEVRRQLRSRGLIATPQASRLPGQLTLGPGQTASAADSKTQDLLPPGAVQIRRAK